MLQELNNSNTNPNNVKVTRGVQNNNPGNIRKSDVLWRGEILGSDQEFETFDTPIDGIRAMVKNFIFYQQKMNLLTITQMINCWAPSSENNTDAYIKSVASRVGIPSSEPINLQDLDIAYKFIDAVIKHENANYVYPLDVIQAGIKAALV